MAPYLGLITIHGREPSTSDYSRRDLSSCAFKMSPSPDDRTVIVQNDDQIVWRPSHPWPQIGQIVIFNDALDPEMLAQSEINHPPMEPGDTLVIERGSLKFDHTFTPSNRNAIDPQRFDDMLSRIVRLEEALDWLSQIQPSLVTQARRKFRL